MTEVKNSTEIFKGKFDQAEKKNEWTQSQIIWNYSIKGTKRKQWKKNEESLRDLCDTINGIDVHVIGASKGTEKEKQKAFLKKWWQKASQHGEESEHSALWSPQNTK